ncbi:MAG: radical SAM protein [Nanopusillaceae archaeon]
MTDIEITWKCNQNCINCIFDTEKMYKDKDIKIEEIYKLIDNLDENKDYLGISGGEPTLRKELIDILKYIKKNKPNLLTMMVTNGTMLAYRKYVKAIKNAAPENFYIAIAIYGHKKEIHEAHTRSQNSFYYTLLGIKNSILEGLWTEVRYMITKLNYKYLTNFAWFVIDEFPEVNRVVMLNIKYTGNALKYKDVLFIKESEAVPYVIKAVDILLGNGFKEPPNNHEIRLYHFPLCLLPEKYWKFSEGVTKFDDDVIFIEKCNKCKVKEMCPKIWKSYIELAGDSEFIPINEE